MNSFRRPSLFLLPLALAVSGCHSRYVEASVQNATGKPLRLIEVDYPSASFGVSALDPHATYNYRFKLQGSAPLTLTYMDSTSKPHSVTGPEVHEGQQGPLLIRIDEAGVTWKSRLQ